MLSENEARFAYNELLGKLREMSASDLATEIERAVGRGRVQVRERISMQEQLPARAALETALRMLAAWIEPTFLFEEALALLREATDTKVEDIRWMPDRLDIVEAEAGIDVPPVAEQHVIKIPSTTPQDDLRGRIRGLHEMIAALASAEEE